MLYSDKNLIQKNTHFVLNTYYDGYMIDALYSGIKKFNFIRLLPKDSLTVNLDVQHLVKGQKIYPVRIRFIYYYFRKENRNFDGLVAIKKDELHKKFE